MNGSTLVRFGVLAAVAVLLLGACGGGSDNAAESGSEVKLAFLWEKAGESDYATDDAENGAQLALSEINAAGGINGAAVVAERFAASPVDPLATAQAILEASDASPAVLIGVTAQVAAAVAPVDSSGVPLIYISSPDPQTVFGGDSSSELIWGIQPYVPDVAAATVDYLVETKGFSKIAVLGTNEAYGRTSVDATTAALRSHGLEPYLERLHSPSDTDFAGVAVEAVGADAVVNWSYPGPLAAQLKRLSDNGINIRTYDGASGPIVAGAQLAPPEAIGSLSVANPCNPSDANTEQLRAFVDAYVLMYGVQPTYTALSTYDAVKVAAAAIERAGSTDSDAVNEALGKTDMTGACGKYLADEGHVLFHQAVIVDYAADGTSKVAETIELPPVPVGG